MEKFGGAAAARKVVVDALWLYATEERELRSGRPVSSPPAPRRRGRKR